MVSISKGFIAKINNISGYLKYRNVVFAQAKNYSKNSHKENEENQLNESTKLTTEQKNQISTPPSDSNVPDVFIKDFWDERRAVKKIFKQNSLFKRINSMTDYYNEVQKLRNIPRNFAELGFILKKKLIRRQVLSQTYLPQRRAVLKADLAAAHFLLSRGGSVRFLGHKSWATRDKAQVPASYVPGYYVEELNAEGTDLCREGLDNLTDLIYLKSICFKGLKDIDDWCMDWIANQYHEQLTHLDITDCTNVTHRGLSCFYHFEKLKKLTVTGVSDSADFKVACLMLQDVMPDLEIVGIDLSIPLKIEADKVKLSMPNDSKIVSQVP